MTTEQDKRSEQQASAQFDSIKDMVERLRHCQECDGTDCELSDEEIFSGIGYMYQGKPATEDERRSYHDEEAARQAISEDPLSVQVRSGWYSPGSEAGSPEEYEILLCTGGPACRIIGELGQYGEPDTAVIQHQDWFTPWTEWRMDSEQEQIVLEYARCFYFGE